MAIVAYQKPQVKKYKTANESVKINGNDPLPKLPLYPCILGDLVSISADAVDDAGDLQIDLDQAGLGLPSSLFLPFTKYSGGADGSVLDEVYFDATLTNGLFYISGTFPSSGNWIMKEDRVNQSLKAVGVNWEIQTGNVSVMVK